jgi:hypothetical protein
MSYNNLSVALTAEQKADIIQKLIDLKILLPFLVSLSSKERQKLRKTGGKRQGYVIDVRNVAKANPSSIPEVIDMAEFEKDASLYADMSEILEHLLPLYEGILDTTIAVGSEAIKTADQCYGILKVSDKGNNTQLRNSLSEIKRKHFFRKKKGDDTGASKA